MYFIGANIWTELYSRPLTFLGRLIYPLVVLVDTFTYTATTLALAIFDYTGESNVKNKLDALVQNHGRIKSTVR